MILPKGYFGPFQSLYPKPPWPFPRLLGLFQSFLAFFQSFLTIFQCILTFSKAYSLFQDMQHEPCFALSKACCCECLSKTSPEPIAQQEKGCLFQGTQSSSLPHTQGQTFSKNSQAFKQYGRLLAFSKAWPATWACFFQSNSPQVGHSKPKPFPRPQRCFSKITSLCQTVCVFAFSKTQAKLFPKQQSTSGPFQA